MLTLTISLLSDLLSWNQIHMYTSHVHLNRFLEYLIMALQNTVNGLPLDNDYNFVIRDTILAKQRCI